MEEVRAQAEHMVQRTEIVRQANAVAQRILDDADEEARRSATRRRTSATPSWRAWRSCSTGSPGRCTPAGPKSAAPLVERPARATRPRTRRTVSSTRTSRDGRRPLRGQCRPAAALGSRPWRRADARRAQGRGGAGRPLCVGHRPGRSVVPPGGAAEVDLVLRAFDGGIEAAGTVRAPWVGTCRRCAAPVTGELAVEVRERFVDAPRSGPESTRSSTRSPTISSTSARWCGTRSCSTPMAPLCRDDCAGLCALCGADRNEGECGCVAPRDPRWANLDVLR